MRFQADTVIGCVDIAIGDAHIDTVGNIVCRLLPVQKNVYGDAVNHQVPAALIGLNPARGIPHGNTGDGNITTVNKLSELWAEWFLWAHLDKIVIDAVDLPGIKQTVDVECKTAALPIDSA